MLLRRGRMRGDWRRRGRRPSMQRLFSPRRPSGGDVVRRKSGARAQIRRGCSSPRLFASMRALLRRRVLLTCRGGGRRGGGARRQCARHFGPPQLVRALGTLGPGRHLGRRRTADRCGEEVGMQAGRRSLVVHRMRTRGGLTLWPAWPSRRRCQSTLRAGRGRSGSGGSIATSRRRVSLEGANTRHGGEQRGAQAGGSSGRRNIVRVRPSRRLAQVWQANRGRRVCAARAAGKRRSYTA